MRRPLKARRKPDLPDAGALPPTGDRDNLRGDEADEAGVPTSDLALTKDGPVKDSIPRWTGHNSGTGDEPVSSGVTWWTLVGTQDPPLAVGRDPDDAERRLHDVLLRYHQEDADPLPADPEARAERDLGRWTAGALVVGTARDEVAAFRTWRLVSSLTVEEALLRWREAFPVVGDVDPLAELAAERSLTQVPGGHTAPRRPRRRHERP